MSALRLCAVALVVGALLTGEAGLARAETPAAPPLVEVLVDALAPATPLERVWAFHGYDEVNYTVTPEGRGLLDTLVAAHSAPVHIRTHFLFNDGDGVGAPKWGSTNVYREDSAGKPLYDWALTDELLDTFVHAGAVPLVELGFMPEALSLRPQPYRNSSVTSLDGGCFFPPKDYEKWAALIRAWARHAEERFPESTPQWLWELWNEPDIGYWQGSFAEYAKLYDFTEAALHEVLPRAPLGGPSIVDPKASFLRAFLEHCARGRNNVTGRPGTRLDFVSFHAKGGVALTGGHVRMDLGNQLRLHEAGFRAVADAVPFARTPIYITEADPDGCAACPATQIPAFGYRTSPAYGAYEVAMMKRSLELAARLGVRLRGVLTWAFTFPGTKYFAGYRALATNGIDLPVLGAFKLLGRLAGVRLSVASTGARSLDDILAKSVRGEPDIDGLASYEEDGTLRVLVWNYHDELVAAAPAEVKVRLRVPALFGPAATVSHLRVDEVQGNAHAAWLAQGAPATPTPEQLTALRDAMNPALLATDASLPVSGDGELAVDLALPRFGMSLLTIRPAGGPSDWRAGLDERSGAAGGGAGCDCRSNAEGPRRTGLDVAGALVAAAAVRRRRRRGGGVAGPRGKIQENTGVKTKRQWRGQ